MKKDKYVICDTNIWYDIAEGRISENDFKDCHLFGTYISVYELHKSDSIVNKRQVWKDAVHAFFKYSSNFKMFEPDNYLKSIEGMRFNYSNEKKLFGTLRMAPDIIDGADESALRINIYESRDKLIGMQEAFMTGLRSAQQESVNFKTIQRSLAPKKNHHVFLENTTIPTLLGFSKIDFTNWHLVELWLTTFNYWFIRLTRDTHIKMKANDFNDLMNLIYVKPGMLYWSRDGKKTIPFIHEIGLEHYLLDR